MFSVTRPGIPAAFDEAALLRGLEHRRAEGKVGDKLFVPSWRSFKHSLSGDALHAKCAYCEAVRRVGYELDVEHVRPKASVLRWVEVDDKTLLYPRRVWDESAAREVDEKPVEDRASARDGYWWNAYRWSNYLLACKECNSGWKREFFPLADERARWSKREDEARDEGALLLDPTASEFDPDEHFRWTIAGIVEPRTPRAKATIIACGLNRKDLRDERIQHRATALDPWLLALKASLQDRPAAERAMLQLSIHCEPRAPFTAMSRARVDEFFRENALRIRRPWKARVR